MARERSVPQGDDSYAAGADLTTKQFLFMKEGTTLSAQGQRTCVPVTSPLDVSIGVLQNAPPLGGAAQVRRLGKSKVKSDGNVQAITIGDFLGWDANGKAIRNTTADRPSLGRADLPSGADGVIITIDLDQRPTAYRAPA